MDVILARLDSVPTVENLAILASKQDIKEMDDRIMALSTEIAQLWNEMRNMQGNFNSLQTTVDSQLAANMSMATGSVGRDLTRDPGRTTYVRWQMAKQAQLNLAFRVGGILCLKG